MQSSTRTPQGSTIETRSIDWVPLNERRGKPWTLFPLWFMSNANVTTLATGMIGVALGATFLSSALAVILGVALGTVFTAFHSAQGPQLGLPQMIQSRAQFGYRGVILICLVVVFSLVGFNMFNQMLGADALTMVTGLEQDTLWYVILTTLAIILAIFGYHWIHKMQQGLTVLFLATFGVFSVAILFTSPLGSDALSFAGWNWPAFLVQFGASAACALGWAPYVSDYSRYLPPATSPTKALWYTYAGIFVGAAWLMLLGTYVAASAAGADPLAGVAALADNAIQGSGTWLLASAIPGLIAVVTVNIYAAAMELITVADSIKPVRPTRSIRVTASIIVGVLALIGNLVATGDFLAIFGSFLVVLLYILVPWTSVNLVDYYVVRRGHYAIREIFNRHGIYGTWGWRGTLSYLLGLAAMVPFVVTTWWNGPIATAMGGASTSPSSSGWQSRPSATSSSPGPSISRPRGEWPPGIANSTASTP